MHTRRRGVARVAMLAAIVAVLLGPPGRARAAADRGPTATSSEGSSTPRKGRLWKKIAVGGALLFAGGGLANMLLASNTFDASRPMLLYDAKCIVCKSFSALLKFGEGGLKAVTFGLVPKTLTARVSVYDKAAYAAVPQLDADATQQELHMLVPDGKGGLRVAVGGAIGEEIALNLRVPRSLAQHPRFRATSDALYHWGSCKRKEIKARDQVRARQTRLPPKKIPPRPQRR